MRPTRHGKTGRRGRRSGPAGAAGAELLGWALLLLLLAACLLVASLAESALPLERVERRDRLHAAPPATVELRSEALVRGPEIRLQEIAEIQSADPETSRRLGAIGVGRAPLPGLSRTLDLAYLKARVALREPEAGALLYQGPAAVQVTTASRRLTGAEQVEAVRRELLALRAAPGGELSVQAATLPPDLVLPAGEPELRVRLSPGAERGSGVVSATLEAWVDGSLARTVSVPVRVAVLEEVLVAARTLPRQQPLTAADVRVERRSLRPGQEPLREPAAAVGQRARRTIAQGESLLVPMLERPPAVRRGQRVLLTVEGRGLKAVARGEAREDGSVGQLIRVKNLASGREIYGRVAGDQDVRVAF